MWYKNKFFEITIGIILVLLIVFLTIQLGFVFNILFLFIGAIFLPIVIACALYYVLRPIRAYLEEKKVPRLGAIIIIYLIFFAALAILFAYIWPYIVQQILEFKSTPEKKIKELESHTLYVMNLFNFAAMPEEELRQTMVNYFQTIMTWVSANILGTLSSIATITSYFIITPFLVFYLLKDDDKLLITLEDLTPAAYSKEIKKMMVDVDETVSSYVTSQLLVASVVATLVFIGYQIIGLNYALLLAVIAFVFNLIPFVGPFISTVPALLIGLTHSPFMGFEVIIVVLVVHFLDLNFISPRIIGKRLKIHPVTIILLLVMSMPVFGVLGMFLITPIYAMLKVLFKDFNEIKFTKRKSEPADE